MMSNEVVAIIAIIVGLLMCFWGYKIQKLLIMIAWFCLGFMLMKEIGFHFIDNANLLMLLQIISGIVLASVGFKLEKLALCIAVSYLTYITITPYITGFEEGISIIIHFGLSLLLGILSTLFIKPILVIVSSFAGANIILHYLPSLISLDYNLLLITAIIIGVMGVLVQFKVE